MNIKLVLTSVAHFEEDKYMCSPDAYAHLLFQALARHKAALAEAATTAQDQEEENIALATLERRVILGSDEANQRSRY